MKKFFFDTGVRPRNNPNLFGNQVWKGGTKQIPFSCENVPDGSEFMFGANRPDQPESKLDRVIVREIHNSDLLSKYAYFRTPRVS